MNWEYQKIAVKSGVISIEELNRMGKEGWENYDHAGNVYFFKRQISNEVNFFEASKSTKNITKKN
jgi:hypothetical protein